MTREEEAFIEGHEHALDNHLAGITEEDVREYERLIEKRRREENNEESVSKWNSVPL